LGILLATLFVGFACTEEVNLVAQPIDQQNKEVFIVVGETPQFPGGMEAFYAHLQQEMKYPKEARAKGVEGKVFTQFVIDRDGAVSNVQVIRGIGDFVNKEAVRALESLPNFKPASQRGRTVRVKKVLPIIFKLDPNTSLGTIIFEEVQNKDFKFKINANYADGAWTGTVYDEETGKVLPGANIVIVGTTQGTVSGRDGTFSLVAAKEADVNISFIGYKSVKLEAMK